MASAARPYRRSRADVCERHRSGRGKEIVEQEQRRLRVGALKHPQVGLRVYIHELRRVEFDDSYLDRLQCIAKRELAYQETALERRERGTSICAGERPGLGNRGIRTSPGESQEASCRDERAVDRQKDA